MNKKIILLSTLVVFMFLISCKKNQLGGKSTITGKVAHHSKAIAYATVFIKFKAKEFPGKDTTVYDDKVRADADGNFSIKCYKGDYYLYGYGYDYALVPPYVVHGGAPVHLRNKEKEELDLAVSEEP